MHDNAVLRNEVLPDGQGGNEPYNNLTMRQNQSVRFEFKFKFGQYQFSK